MISKTAGALIERIGIAMNIARNDNNDELFDAMSNLLRKEIQVMDEAEMIRHIRGLECVIQEAVDRAQDERERLMMEDLSKCPQCGGNADRGIDNCIPPNAYMCSECCAQEDAEKSVIPPAGFSLIREGMRQEGDMRWSNFDQRWTSVFSDSMSQRIEELGFPCARRIAI